MANIKDTASSYETPTTRNITELELVMTNSEIIEKAGTDSDGKEFKYNVIIVDHFEYRVPNSVLTNLKAILQENDKLMSFKVTKTGEGMNTRYTVIPLA